MPLGRLFLYLGVGFMDIENCSNSKRLKPTNIIPYLQESDPIILGPNWPP